MYFYLLFSLKDLSKIEILDMQARLYLNLGVTNECKGEFKEAVNNYEKAMSICRHNDFWELLYQCYSTTGLMYANKLNDCTMALRFLNLGINTAERLSTDRTVRLCQALLSKAEVMIKIGDFHGAKQVLHKAYKMKTTDSADRECIENTLRVGELIIRTTFAIKMRECNGIFIFELQWLQSATPRTRWSMLTVRTVR